MKVCEVCQIEFYPTRGSAGKYCSPDCYVESQRKYQNCPQCGEKFIARRHAKYCSRTCSNRARAGITYDGKRAACRVSKRARQRTYLAEKHGNVCSMCGMLPEWNGKPLVFQVDHINGNNSDDSWDNLRLLCPNCHSQTDTFGGRNIGACPNGKGSVLKTD